MNIVETTSTQIHQQYALSDIRMLFNELNLPLGTQSFFLSEHWFVSWLSNKNVQPKLITFRQNETTIGFVFLGKQSAWYGDTYYLNQTGLQQYDQMWIEHNDIICHEQHYSQCRQALLNLLSQTKNFHRLVVSLTPSHTWESDQTFIWSYVCEQVPYIDLKGLQKDQISMGKWLSKNTRSSINRASNYIKKQHGELSISKIADPLASLTKDIAPLHIAQWQATDAGSGFTNVNFVSFHQQLCTLNAGNYQVEILQISAGEQILGYLYMMLSHKTVYFYLSAINYDDDDNRYKPGMVMHKLAIEYYAALGFERYDFLAGRARYKTSLSTHRYPLYTIHIANNGLKHRILFTLNGIAKRLKQFKTGRK